MLAKLKKLFEDSLQLKPSEDEATLEQQLQTASAVLLLEVARADHDISVLEVLRVQSAIQKTFKLTDSATQTLMEEVDSKIDEVVEFHQFTSLINQKFELEQKCKLIEYMWQVALADGNLDAYEDHFIRKISDLLYIRHSELIAARERARKNAS